MRLPRVLLMLMRVLAVVQVVLGVAFWTGHWYGAVPVHMLSGLAYVLLLWALAIAALVRRRLPALASAAIVSGLVIVALGMGQSGILAGSSYHWVIQALHLLIGLSALGFAERLAKASAPVAALA